MSNFVELKVGRVFSTSPHQHKIKNEAEGIAKKLTKSKKFSIDSISVGTLDVTPGLTEVLIRVNLLLEHDGKHYSTRLFMEEYADLVERSQILKTNRPSFLLGPIKTKK